MFQQATRLEPLGGGGGGLCQGLGFLGFGLWVQGVGFRVQGVGLRVFGFRVQGVGFGGLRPTLKV